MRKGGWIQTYTGKKFYPLDPRLEDIDIVDIAHALSNICRFTGHTDKFYSVAQHCLLVSEHVSEHNALWGLLHDSAETYIGDVNTPLKYTKEMSLYRKIEDNLLKFIIRSFTLPDKEPKEVKDMDTILLRTEARDFRLIHSDWNIYYTKPLKEKIVPLCPKDAERSFLNRFLYLAIKRLLYMLEN